MSVSTITYSNKSDATTTATPDINKIKAADMNEIKSVVNNNASELSGIMSKVINSSGTGYIKYEDGTMICYQTKEGVTDITTEWGSLYTSSLITLDDYPQQFITFPTVLITSQTTSSAQFFICGADDVGGNGTVSKPNGVCLVRPNTRNNIGYILNVLAIGKWK